MAWTHIYDLLLKLASMVLAVVIIIQLPFLPDHGFIPFALMLILFVVLYYGFFRTVSTLLYSKYSLNMNLTWAQAKTLNGAFSPVIPLKWLPMKNLKELAPEVKYSIALAIYGQWAAENKRIAGKRMGDFKNSKSTTKVLTAVMGVLIVYFIIASFLNFPQPHILHRHSVVFSIPKAIIHCLMQLYW